MNNYVSNLFLGKAENIVKLIVNHAMTNGVNVSFLKKSFFLGCHRGIIDYVIVY